MSRTRYTPRPYQAEAIEAGLTYLRDPKMKKRNGIIVAPTGSGKSLVIAEIAHRLKEPCVVFQPTKEILEQNAGKLASYGCRPRIFSASFNSREVGKVTLATIGSVRKHPEMFADCPHVIVDECHYVNAKGGMYKEFFERMAGARILGLTATPYRLATNSFGSELRFLTRTRPRVFRDLVHYTQIPDLFRQGFLSPLRYHDALAIDPSVLEVNTTGAEYADRSVRDHLKTSRFSGRLASQVRRQLDQGRRPLIFTRFVAEAEELAASVPGVATVDAKTPKKQRARVIADFRSGETRAVANVGVLAIGFDYPELDCVVMARPTLSLALYYQMIGRAIRPHPEKEAAHIVDMVGGLQQFGKVESMELRPGGKTGQKWAFFSGRRRLTNSFIEPIGKPAAKFNQGSEIQPTLWPVR